MHASKNPLAIWGSPAGPKRPTVAVCGHGGGNMQVTRMTSVKDERTSAAQPRGIRVATAVKLTSGRVEGAISGADLDSAGPISIREKSRRPRRKSSGYFMMAR